MTEGMSVVVVWRRRVAVVVVRTVVVMVMVHGTVSTFVCVMCSGGVNSTVCITCNHIQYELHLRAVCAQCLLKGLGDTLTTLELTGIKNPLPKSLYDVTVILPRNKNGLNCKSNNCHYVHLYA